MTNSDINQPLLSRTECDILRGIAILGIFLHNYCHWLNPIVKENEYQFFRHNADGFIRALTSPDLNLPLHLLSFLGHYGVPIFRFLSAYGWEMKYGTPQHPTTDNRHPSPLAFISRHYLKLFKMMIVGFVAFTMTDYITRGPHHYALLDIVAMLGMFNNLLPDPDKIIWPGPYWFFGLMLQLYIVYRLLLYRRSWRWTAALMIVCLVVQLFLAPESEALNRYRYNFMGGMLPFGLGLLYARFGRRLPPQANLNLFVVSSALIIVCSLNYYTWTLVPLFVCSGSIGLAKIITKISQKPLGKQLNDFFKWIGIISPALFVCHPITRKIFIPVSRGGDIYAGLALYVTASLLLAAIWPAIMKRKAKE